MEDTGHSKDRVLIEETVTEPFALENGVNCNKKEATDARHTSE